MAKLVREQGLDKFYTNPDIVDLCLSNLYSKYLDFDITIEPAAGNGAFLKKITGNKLGLDISPDLECITEMDFFTYTPCDMYKNILVVGNPPFGKCSSLAIKFFNHASKWANIIAFIVPRTFKRTSVQNRLDLNFHLTFSEDLPTKPCCFSVELGVKCCFQIWERRHEKREVIKLPLEHPHWKFISLGPKDKNNQPSPPENCDFALRAYGGNCGEIRFDKISELRPKSWHFIKNTGVIPLEELVKNLTNINYSISTDTARQNSIGRAELVNLYQQLGLNTHLESPVLL